MLSYVLLVALVVVVVGSLTGEAAQLPRGAQGTDRPMFGAQGWEYLDLGRFWQILLIVGMLSGSSSCIAVSAPAGDRAAAGTCRTCSSTPPCPSRCSTRSGWRAPPGSPFAIGDFWRFWVVHLWVEDFLELFTTIMVAFIFVLLGVVSERTALRVIYFDAILYSVGGVVGTMHHFYFSGGPAEHMALGAFFSARGGHPAHLPDGRGVDVPAHGGEAGGVRRATKFPHRWAVMFLVSVGFWNFLGAGVFGFLINLPMVSYYQIGTALTANHSHAAFVGVYLMLAVGFMLFSLRYLLPAEDWSDRLVGFSFWSLNLGLAWMVFVNLFPLGVLQLHRSVSEGYWASPRAELPHQRPQRTARMAPPPRRRGVHRRRGAAAAVDRLRRGSPPRQSPGRARRRGPAAVHRGDADL